MSDGENVTEEWGTVMRVREESVPSLRLVHHLMVMDLKNRFKSFVQKVRHPADGSC